MKQRSWMLGLVALALLVSGLLPAHAERVTLELTVDQRKRMALVDPGRDAATRPSPLLLIFHFLGDGRTAAPEMAGLSRFSEAWPEATVVYPMAVGHGWLTDAEINDRDVRFVDALIEELKARYQVDERRIYAAGYSNGGYFTQTLFIWRPERFAAFAALGAGYPPLRWATTPRPMMLLVGTNDRLYEVERARNQALRLGSCGGEGTEWAQGATLYADCVGGPPVLFFTYRGGHEWHRDATASIVRFFKEQALPEAPAPRTPLGEPPALEAILGTGKPIFGTAGRPAAESGTVAPVAVACDAAGGYAFLEDTGWRARKIGANGQLAPPIRAELFWAEGLAVDREGNLYVADTGGRRVLRFDAAGKMTRIAGTAASFRPGRAIGFSGDGGPAAEAELSFPQGLAVDRDGNLYIADSENHRVRKVDRDGIITTVAGSGTAGFAGDGGPALSARLNAPSGLAIDRDGNLYVADTGNRRVRRIAPDGAITTVAGTGVPGTGGDGGRAEAAALTSPNALAVDREGNLFIADNHAYRVRKVAADGVITTVLAAPAGQGRYMPDGLAIDRAGNLLVADPFNHRIWKVTGVAAPGLVAGEPFPEP